MKDSYLITKQAKIRALLEIAQTLTLDLDEEVRDLIYYHNKMTTKKISDWKITACDCPECVDDRSYRMD